MNLELLGEEGYGCVLGNPSVLERREPGREGRGLQPQGHSCAVDPGALLFPSSSGSRKPSFGVSRLHCLSRGCFQISAGVVGADRL